MSTDLIYFEKKISLVEIKSILELAKPNYKLHYFEAGKVTDDAQLEVSCNKAFLYICMANDRLAEVKKHFPKDYERIIKYFNTNKVFCFVCEVDSNMPSHELFENVASALSENLNILVERE